jgi:hypothetical protein
MSTADKDNTISQLRHLLAKAEAKLLVSELQRKLAETGDTFTRADLESVIGAIAGAE